MIASGNDSIILIGTAIRIAIVTGVATITSCMMRSRVTVLIIAIKQEWKR